MSAIYKKTITTTVEVDYIKCDKCGHETQFVLAMDVWSIVDGENYCYKCSEKHRVGWFEKKKKIDE